MNETAKKVSGIAVGIGVGAGQTYVLRKWVDPKYQVKRLKRFGQISVLTDIIAGVPAAALGIAGFFGKGPLKRSDFVGPLAACYGASSVTGAVLGLIYPVPAKIPPAAALERARALQQIKLVKAPEAPTEVRVTPKVPVVAVTPKAAVTPKVPAVAVTQKAAVTPKVLPAEQFM